MYVCNCMMEFMDKEKVSFLRGNIDWSLYESKYKKCEGKGCPHAIDYTITTGTINMKDVIGNEEETVQEGQEKR